MKKWLIPLTIWVVDLFGLVLSKKTGWFSDWYAQYIQPIWVGTIGRLFSVLPFSAAEFLLYILILWTLVWAGIRIGRIVQRKKRRHYTIAAGCYRIFLLAVLLFTLFTWTCGVNYARTSFVKSNQIEVRVYTTEEWKKACEILTEQVNTYAVQVKRDGQGRMVVGEHAEKRAVRAMQLAGEGYASLSGYYPNPKAVSFSQILSYQNVTGIYSPFTVEANYNQDMEDYNIPFTMCHELSHLKGFMKEEEANFIAYLACMKSDSEEFRYSGTMLGWLYGTNELYKRDTTAYKEMWNKLCKEAKADFEANSAFWDKYEGKISEVAESINDSYLKANGQEKGIESYDKAADLIVGEVLNAEKVGKQ